MASFIIHNSVADPVHFFYPDPDPHSKCFKAGYLLGIILKRMIYTFIVKTSETKKRSFFYILI